jgi:cysteine rich repeat protein
MNMKTLGIAAVGLFVVTAASAQTGPVATMCKDDIAKYCAGKTHGDREVRACLEANKAKVSADCKTALETTGGGKGKGRNAK